MTFSTNELLFKFVYEAVIGDGGDGDAVVGFKFQDYREMAKQFVQMFPDFRLEERENHCNIQSANSREEYIIFTSAKNFDEIKLWAHRILTY